MDSTELGVDLASFADAYHLARRHGLRRTGHAGEAVGTGPQNIRIALDALGVERIDHGVAVVEDPELVRRMAGDRVPITVCPNSNIVIANRFPSLAEHPFGDMRRAGLLATLNTDDPGMTDLDLGVEYRTVAAAQGFDFDDVAAVALDGIEASWLDDADRRTLRAEFETTLATLRPTA
jgi:adenosine deaminase